MLTVQSCQLNFHFAITGIILNPTLDIYYLAFPNDRWFSKTIVCSAYVIETLQTVLATRDAFRNFGTGWGNMNDLDQVGWLWFSVPVMSSLSALT